MDIDVHCIKKQKMIAVVTAVKALIVYWALYFFVKRWMAKRPNVFVVTMRLVGVVCFAGVPMWVMKVMGESYPFASIAPLQTGPALYWLAIGIPVVLAVNARLSKQEKHRTAYPAIRSNVWDIGMVFENMFTWAPYLVAYEFMFRGYLLFQSIDSWGIVPAVAVNVLLYALAHLPKGTFETLGAVPLGVVFCTIAIQTGSFWPVFILHFTMAFSNDLFAVWRNPSARFRFIL